MSPGKGGRRGGVDVTGEKYFALECSNFRLWRKINRFALIRSEKGTKHNLELFSQAFTSAFLPIATYSQTIFNRLVESLHIDRLSIHHGINFHIWGEEEDEARKSEFLISSPLTCTYLHVHFSHNSPTDGLILAYLSSPGRESGLAHFHQPNIFFYINVELNAGSRYKVWKLLGFPVEPHKTFSPKKNAARGFTHSPITLSYMSVNIHKGECGILTIGRESGKVRKHIHWRRE